MLLYELWQSINIRAKREGECVCERKREVTEEQKRRISRRKEVKERDEREQ